MPLDDRPDSDEVCLVTAFVDRRSIRCKSSIAMLKMALPDHYMKKGLVNFNADHTKEEVLALIDEAIEVAMKVYRGS